MDKIIRQLYAQATLLGACGLFTGQEKTLEQLVELFTSPQGQEFCIENRFPNIATVRLFKDTPLHRDNFAKLALAGYYDNLLFHRVIDGFVIQGGDPFTRDTSLVAQWGEGGPSYTIKAEMRDAEGNPLHTHVKGALAAARQGDLANPFKESSGSQFYLVQNPDHCTHLDGEYTVFGETISGLHVIDRIASQPTDRMDRPIADVKIISIKPNKELNSK